MAVLANDSAETPRCDQQRAGVAQRLAFSPCTLRAPGQAGVIGSHCSASLGLKAGLLLSKVSSIIKCISLRCRAGMMS
jgi:hypothetical protein